LGAWYVKFFSNSAFNASISVPQKPPNNELDRSGGNLRSNGGAYFRRSINSTASTPTTESASATTATNERG
jgi:hypothetical protein